MTETTRVHWSSRRAFLLSTIGAAVGLGNLWRFPFIAGQNGGGAFVLIYIGFIVLLGIPIVMAELAIGRRGQRSAVDSMEALTAAEGRNRAWITVGWFSLLIPLLGLSFYSVVAGWALDYIVKAGAGAFNGFDAAQSGAAFDGLMASPWRLLLFHSLFMYLSVLVVSKGLHGGIERVLKVVMPALFVLLIIMVSYSIFAADITSGIRFLFEPDFTKITPAVLLMALGQAFFSLAVAVGVFITYGSYLPKEYSLASSAATIAAIDTGVALLAGLAIFPLVFQYGLDPSGGPGLIFVTLPVAFGQMPGGQFFGLLFFVLLFFAAISTAIGMLEPAISWFEDRGLKRSTMTAATGFAVWLVGVSALLSFNVWSDVKPLSWLPLIGERNIFEVLDFTVSNLMLPINALLIALFAGWGMSRLATRDELDIGDGIYYLVWRIIIRYIAPLAIVFIVYTSLFQTA